MQIKGNNLYAANGMILTDGKIYGKEIYLANGADKSGFYEISEDEFEKAVESEVTP